MDDSREKYTAWLMLRMGKSTLQPARRAFSRSGTMRDAFLRYSGQSPTVSNKINPAMPPQSPTVSNNI
jgi:hypothetical protein